MLVCPVGAKFGIKTKAVSVMLLEPRGGKKGLAVEIMKSKAMCAIDPTVSVQDSAARPFLRGVLV